MACYICENLEAGDTLYASSDWDGGLGFDYIRDIQYCPVCGRKLAEQTENPCDSCVCDDGKHLMYCMNCKGIAWKTEPPKVEDEPQTEDEILREQCRAFMGIVEQTERSE